MQQIFSGLPASPGVGIGALYIYSPAPHRAHLAERPSHLSPEQEWQRFAAARQRVDDELAQLSQLSNSVMAELFLVHREILHDKTFVDAVRTGVMAGASAADATQRATTDLVRLFQNLSDSYFASRAADIRDVGQRLLSHLEGVSMAEQLKRLPRNTLLIAEDLTPFDTAHLSADRVEGIALAGSAPTAHTAILARNLGLPLVCGLGPGVLALATGLHAIVDGMHGRLLIAPAPETLSTYQETRRRLDAFRAVAEAQTHELALTQEGHRIPVRVNVNSREDVLVPAARGAEGVGLLRTEYLFQNRTTAPSVEEQLNAYREVAIHYPDRVITVRLLDVGGDKPVQYLPQPAEANPFLGVRGVRLLLQQMHILQDQLRALVLLAQEDSGRRVRILVPMVSKISEVYRVVDMLQQIPGATELRRRTGRLQLGIMIEVPAAALLAHRLSPLVDFFSIGTNDLSAYTLAVDRTNPNVATLATPLDPSVLRLIQMTTQAAAAEGIPVSVCGELGGDPSALPLLIGLGVTEVSVAAPSVALVKHAVRQTERNAAQQLAADALACSHDQDVQQLLAAHIADHAPSSAAPDAAAGPMVSGGSL